MASWGITPSRAQASQACNSTLSQASVLWVADQMATINVLPQGLGGLVAIAFVLAVISIVMLIPLLLFFYGYNKGGLWLDEQGVRVQFPAEDAQSMAWSEALYAVDEGEEYLTLSKGKECLG